MFVSNTLIWGCKDKTMKSLHYSVVSVSCDVVAVFYMITILIFVWFIQGNKPWVSIPRGKGIRLTIAEERDKRLAAKQSSS